MKNRWIYSLLILTIALSTASVASAQQNTVVVTADAAMAGTNYGLEMRYEPGSTHRAKVVYNEFGPESIFREKWWMDVSNFHPNRFTRNFYHTVSGMHLGSLLPTVRSDIVLKAGLNYAIGAGAYDNQRNRVGLPRCPVPGDAPFQIQIELTTGCSPTRGIFRMTVWDESGTEICAREAEVQNCQLEVTAFNFETLVEGGIESSSVVYMDEYSSFRTLAP